MCYPNENSALLPFGKQPSHTVSLTLSMGHGTKDPCASFFPLVDVISKVHQYLIIHCFVGGCRGERCLIPKPPFHFSFLLQQEAFIHQLHGVQRSSNLLQLKDWDGNLVNLGFLLFYNTKKLPEIFIKSNQDLNNGFLLSGNCLPYFSMQKSWKVWEKFGKKNNEISTVKD